jgi:hypothetical protein
MTNENGWCCLGRNDDLITTYVRDVPGGALFLVLMERTEALPYNPNVLRQQFRFVPLSPALSFVPGASVAAEKEKRR